MNIYQQHNRRPVRRCYLCGTNTMLPRNADETMLAILKDGRSLVNCRKHFRLLRRFACSEVIENFRKNFLIDAPNLTRVIIYLRRLEQRHQLRKPHA